MQLPAKKICLSLSLALLGCSEGELIDGAPSDETTETSTGAQPGGDGDTGGMTEGSGGTLGGSGGSIDGLGGDGETGTTGGSGGTTDAGTGGSGDVYDGVGAPPWPDDCTPPDGYTVVDSVADLIPYLDDDNVRVAMAEGTYRLSRDDYDSGLLPSPTLLEITGNGNIFDFTCAKIEFDTNLFQTYDDTSGGDPVTELRFLGSENVVKNLHMEDIGETTPWKTALGILMDGRDNRLEGVHLTLRGSKPYGYGDAFGKGGTGTKIGHKKHSAILVRGLRNHVLNTTIIHRAYGHAIFMQAATDPTIEGCYIEGEVRSTDDMLAEEGTGSAADLIDFDTTWGYRLPPGHVMSLQEEGIRAYDGGETWVDGVHTPDQAAHNVTVLNNVVKYMRGGVTLTHATGTTYVEGTTAIGCERGFAVGSSGKIVDCAGDAQYGPVFGVDYENNSNISVDITLLPGSVEENGYGSIMYLGGSNHNITLRSSETGVNQSVPIQVSGAKEGVRFADPNALANQNNLSANGIVINNLTEYPIELNENASNCTGQSNGPVIDNGTNNSITEN